ncbi:hypothetical protein FIBSPDRAFT_1049558 [Athelia psychrophila]|uniref:Uncharacterized protein n=1 Tax=Athelia psychrophila TaxID=1759441 RepID=A0A166C205_9AGAM|nr:hypothetical protein FIBSPDRAFT_1049558 [Fibularhizoctonia sp. CBS 109695]
MDSFSSSDPRPLAHIPPIAIFDPLEFGQSLPASQYTLIRTDDLKIMYKEISRVQAYLHNLIDHGVAAQSLVVDDSKQRQPAAIERIPSEILSMIFEHLVPPQNCNDLTPIQIPELTDVLLPAQICRSWRETAIATPSLWSSLQFEFVPVNSVERMADKANTCLARAKSNPLSIHISCPEEDLTQYRPIIAALLAHSHQWSNLSLAGEAYVLVRDTTRPVRSRLSMLRRLAIDCSLSSWSDSFDAFQAAPNLRIVELINDYASHDLDRFPLLPWRQLQQIAFTGRAGDSLELLRLSPNLQVFKVIMVFSMSLVGHNHLHHASLRKLDVEAGHRDSSDWFGELTMPALVSLSYVGKTFPGDGITSFVKRSEITGSLHTFSLKLTPSRHEVVSCMASTDILKCLVCMPNLTQLSLHDQQEDRYTDNGHFHAGNITSICASLKTSSVLPKLKRFAITGPPRMSCVLVADMVMGRWRDDGVAKGCARLESVEVNYPGPCTHAKSSLGRTPSYSRSTACARALAILSRYRNDGLRVVGPPVDEYECIECIEKQIMECGFEIVP